MWLRKRVTELEKYIRVVSDDLARHETMIGTLHLSDASSRENRELAAHLISEHTQKIKQLECGQTGHIFDKWERCDTFDRLPVRQTCSECGFTRLRFPQTLELKEIKALLELGVLTKSDLPKPKPRKKARK